MDLNLGQGASTGGLSYKGLQLYHNYKTDATDKSPQKSNHGVMYTGRSLAFDGVNDYVDLDGLTIDGNQMTFALWVNSSQQDDYKYLIDFNTPKRAIFAWNHTTNNLGIYDNVGWGNFGVAPSDGSWHRIVFSINNTTAQCFVDGVQLGTDITITALDVSNAAVCKIGSENDGGGNNFNGELSNVQIWDKAWTADDVEYDYANVQATPNDIANNSTALSVANCRTWLPICEGAGTTLYDGGVVLGDELIDNGGFALGDDIVPNGDFSAPVADDWTLVNTNTTNTITNNSQGGVDFVSDGSIALSLQQLTIFDTSKSYQLVIDAVCNENNSAGIKLQYAGANESIGYVNSTGIHTFTFSPSNTKFEIYRRTGAQVTDVTIKSISVKEVTNWSLGTGWSISDGTLGDELVGNGTFDDDTSGWSVYGNSSISSINNQLQVSANSSTNNGAYQSFSTTVDKTYSLSTYAESSAGAAKILIGTGIGNGSISNNTGATSGQTAESSTTFVATSSTTYISLQTGGSSSDLAVYDNISVKEVPHGWDESWVAGDTKAVFDGSAYSNATASQALVNGREYLVEVDAIVDAGGFKLQQAGNDIIAEGTSGSYSGTFTAGSGGGISIARREVGQSNKFSIDNISVKEVQPKENGTVYDGTASTTASTGADWYDANNSITGANWQTGVIGSEVETPFDGVDDYVEIEALGADSTATGMTQSYWVKKDALSGTHRLVHNAPYGFGFGGSNIYAHNVTSQGTDNNAILWNAAGLDNTLLNLVIVRGSTDVKLYVNGALEQTTALTNSASGTYNLDTGSGPDISYGTSSQAFDGNIHNVSIFDHALTATEVSELYALGKAGDVTGHSKADTNLVGYWKNTGVQKWDDLTDGKIRPNLLSGTDTTLSSGANVSIASWTALGFANNDTVKLSTTVTGLTSGYTQLIDVNSGSNGLTVDSGSATASENGDHIVYAHISDATKGVKHSVAAANAGTVMSDISVQEITQGNHGTFKNHVFGNIPQTGLMSYNKPMLFDGSKHVINTTGLNIALSGQSTHFGWFVPKSITGTQAIYNTDKDTVNRIGFGLYNDALKFSIFDGGYTTHTVNTAVEIGKLYFVACIVNNSVLTVYINGEATTNNGGGNIYTYHSRIIIGSTHTDPVNTNYHGFDGLINEVGSFDTALTADEVSELYGNGTPLDATTHSKVDNLQGYWRNDGDSVWVDRSGNNNNGTVSGTPETILLPEARNGRDVLGMPINNVNNGYLALHGDGYVEVADDASLDFGTGDFALEAWVKAKHVTTGSSYNAILGLGGDGFYATDSATLMIHSDMKVRFRIGSNTPAVGTVLTEGDWVHLVGTREDGTAYLYVDGVLIDSGSNSNNLDNTHTKYIGKEGTAARYYKDAIDEPRIYSRALTEAEVLQNYNAGKSKHRND